MQRPTAAFATSHGVRAVDELGELGDQVGPYLLVPLGGLGVVAHDEPLRPGTLVAVPARGDVDLFDPQVVGDGSVAARPAPGGGLVFVWRSSSATTSGRRCG